jgi:protoporphyrinogen oxidase
MKLAADLDPSRLMLGNAVVDIDTKRRIARLASGIEVAYHSMVSTAPLDRLTVLAGRADLATLAAGLRHSSTHVVGIGIEGDPPPHLRGKNWMYFPESNCPFYRVTVFSNYSPNNVPSPDTWSLMAEVSESEFKPVDHPSVVESVLEGMRATGLVTTDARVLSRWHTVLPYGYPIPTLERDGILGEVLPALEGLGIYSRGRFGAWKYEVGNQDHSFMQGWECIDRICAGAGSEAELTYTSPDVVNSRPRARAVAL